MRRNAHFECTPSPVGSRDASLAASASSVHSHDRSPSISNGGVTHSSSSARTRASSLVSSLAPWSCRVTDARVRVHGREHLRRAETKHLERHHPDAKHATRNTRVSARQPRRPFFLSPSNTDSAPNDSGGAYSRVCCAAEGPSGPYSDAIACSSTADPKSARRTRMDGLGASAPAFASPPPDASSSSLGSFSNPKGLRLRTKRASSRASRRDGLCLARA